uniref:Uncharacterized protein n=2 Tax=Oryza TaxID=4527 RepID=A0A0E0NJQ1_ORYRU
MDTPGSSCSTHSVASRSLALLMDTDASSRDDVVPRDGSYGAAGPAAAELRRLKWCAHTWSDGSGTANGGRAAATDDDDDSCALLDAVRLIGCSLPAPDDGSGGGGGIIIAGLSLVEPTRE